MQAIVCRACGSKIAATRQRCPKCLVQIGSVDPAAPSRDSRRLPLVAGALLGGIVLAAGVLWIAREEAAPSAGTRTAVAAAARPEEPNRDDSGAEAAPEVERPRAFMEPAHLGTVAYGSGDFEGALAQFEAAVAKNPRDAESTSNLGQVLVKLGRTGEAIPYFERACALNPDRWAYRFNLARALGLLRRWDESIDAYRRAQRLFPNDYITTFNLALALHKKGDEAAAIEEYRKAIALNPEEPSFRMALGISHEALRQNREAAAAYAEYLRLAPSAPDADKVRARIESLL